MIASKLVASTNTDAPTTNCTDIAEIQAAILFPSLGTPFVAPDSKKSIKLYIVIEDKCTELFDIRNGKSAPLAWYFINRHLRLTPFSETTKTSATIKGNGLYSSEAVAKKAIKVWYHGVYGSGQANSGTWNNILRNHDDEIIATLRPSAVDFFVKAKAAYGLIDPAHKLGLKEADINNQPLRHLFEIELDRAGLKVPPQVDRTYSIAWFVTCVYAKAKHPKTGKPVLPGVTQWEHQDKLIYDFIAMMQKAKQHFTVPFTFDVPGIQHDDISKPNNPDEGKRLKSYHPVMFKSCSALRIGHLSDVHVNSRHFALAKSEAEAIPGVSGPIGAKLTNSFVALRELFDNMRNQKADAIFITGDLIDFNHNFNPSELSEGAPKDQWAQYDLSQQFSGGKPKNGKLYPRGLDDILIYSLVKHSYQHDCPVFMTTGNHEAYDVPYGVSPRLGNFGIALTYEQTVEYYKEREKRKNAKTAEGMRAGDAIVPERAVSAAGSTEETLARASNMGLVTEIALDVIPLLPGAGSAAKQGSIAAKDRLTSAKQDVYDLEGKLANDGVAADHNLTIYEACMAYGPSAGQIVKAWNFVPANFDWFFMLFTPLADFRLRYGTAQCLIGLDWGDSEIMVNANMSAKEAWSSKSADGGVLSKAGAILDNLQGLPRSDRSINDNQKALIDSALSEAGKQSKNILFTHFTLLNYGMAQSYCTWTKGKPALKPSQPFEIGDTVFNDYNRGTFSKNRRWLFSNHINAPTGGLHYTLSGHSHRAGVYAIDHADPDKAIVRAFEPSLPGKKNDYLHVLDDKVTYSASSSAHRSGAVQTSSRPRTRIIVSSCGGPIGVQTVHEDFHGWDLRPPSGTLLDTTQPGQNEIQRITATAYKQAKPRFCVMLDYLMVVAKQEIISWQAVYNTQGKKQQLSIQHLPDIVPFIAEMEVHVGDSFSHSFASHSCKLTPAKSFGHTVGRSTVPSTVMYQVELDASLIASFDGKALALVSLHFDKQALSAHPLYAHYSFDDPWIFPVEKLSPNRTSPGGLRRSAGLPGQVPDFKQLGEINPSDYYFVKKKQ